LILPEIFINGREMFQSKSIFANVVYTTSTHFTRRTTTPGFANFSKRERYILATFYGSIVMFPAEDLCGSPVVSLPCTVYIHGSEGLAAFISGKLLLYKMGRADLLLPYKC